MKTLIQILTTIILLLSSVVAQDFRIIGGDPVEDPETYPWMVALIEGDDNISPSEGQFCGGVIVDEFWVITAAHCVTLSQHNNASDGIDVLVGVLDLNNSIQENRIPIDYYVQNDPSISCPIDDSNWEYWGNDVALLRLSEAVEIEPIKIIDRELEDYTGKILGWGFGSTNNQLFEADIFINNELCPVMDELNILTGYEEVLTGTNEQIFTCHQNSINLIGIGNGDSGGPLAYQSVDGSFKLLGVASWAFSYPVINPDIILLSVFTNLFDDVNWIYSYIPNPGCTDSEAINYNYLANEDDGTCFYDCVELDIDIYGDVNNDYVLNQLDVILIVDLILYPSTSIQSTWCSSDYNNDNNVNILDIVGIINETLNLYVSNNSSGHAYISKNLTSTGNNTYQLNIDLYSSDIISGVQITTKAPSGKKIKSVKRSQQIEHMNFDYSISSDSMSATVLYYGITGQTITNGLNSLFSIDLKSSQDLGRTIDDSEFSMIGLTNNGESFFNYDIISSEELGRIANYNGFEIPRNFIMHPAYPNPFNPTTNIDYEISEGAHVKIAVYNLRGEFIESLINSRKEPGIYSTIWDSKNQSSGVYLVKITVDNNTIVEKITLLK